MESKSRFEVHHNNAEKTQRSTLYQETMHFVRKNYRKKLQQSDFIRNTGKLCLI